jgi:hypothetical protein
MRNAGFRLMLLAAIASLPAWGEVNRSWDELMQRLQPGRTVVVVQQSRKQAEGKLLALTAEAITVRVDEAPLVIPRDEVFRVRIANIRRRNTLAGLGIGAAAGAIFGVSASPANRGAGAAAGAMLFCGPGALAGGVVPIGAPLYEAPGGLRKKVK